MFHVAGAEAEQLFDVVKLQFLKPVLGERMIKVRRSLH
jgi:hypothetical protein